MGKMGRGRRGKRTRRRRVGGNERMILVRSVKEKDDKIQFQNKDGKKVEEIYEREEFHLVNLKLNKIYHDCLPSLPQAHKNYGTMLACAHSIFIFGCRDEEPSDSDDTHIDTFGDYFDEQVSYLKNYVKSEENDMHFYVGGSYIRVDPTHNKHMVVPNGRMWDQVPPTNSYSRNFTCLNGDIYSFPPGPLLPEVLHLNSDGSPLPHGVWKPLPMPPELVSSFKLLPVIADPTNNRILVHSMRGKLYSPSLYAFYPPKDVDDDGDSGTWECLHPKFPPLRHVLHNLLLDGVIYFHGDVSKLLCAYDLDSGKWLDVEWSNRVIENDLSVDDLCSMEFESFLCLDDTNKILTLARERYQSLYPPYKNTIFFFTFKAKRCDSTIMLTPLYTRSYALHSASAVNSFLVLY